ncbi:aminotransferase class III-fold pyridoxal phosphate-dependent enzyme, partial [Candidatus Bathyarchaeota archaeon]|nr:aminotransferase class III-fold pyridoxal phosphate-dependent enzyme [Candidatus Bathyarchaeota archaeon]
EDRLVDHASVTGLYFKEKLARLQQKYSIVREARGLGLMLALENRFDVYSLLQKTLENGIVMLDAGRNILRFLPPLCITRAQVDRSVDALDQALEQEQVARVPSQAIA